MINKNQVSLALRVHLTVFFNTEKPSTRCSFTDIQLSGLDPRLPISGFTPRISNDVTIPSAINEATLFPFKAQLFPRTIISFDGAGRQSRELQGLPGVWLLSTICLWKNAQKIAKKNKASETINKATPIFKPLCTAVV